MGIKVEFNPDLALRDIREHQEGKRKIEECIPEILQAGKIYNFLKYEQRNYWLEGELPLVQTFGNNKFSRPLASIIILEATHFLDKGLVYTKGKYKIIEVFSKDKIEFEWMYRVNSTVYPDKRIK